ncbi:type I 3-dehydroquinate dehydratase [Georgenia ruanii]|uniref:3-dehydroquinate dehydratase n=1 Tax=Georgenia ruanii TaxID=348442 RepID=A0A7J9UTS9_9MICO|nr:type I 3-dehydroquinate dehydratase [Georgenia ruanii]MPV87723.1 type I 3-dehydroquinate dehydratase [Georgenia ruanii]
MPAVTVKDVVIGEGRPKIIVPLTGADVPALHAEASALAGHPVDVVEWRVDHLAAPAGPDQVGAVARELAGALGGLPLLVTVRTAAEGGARAIDDAAYGALCRAIVASGAADLVDVELFRDEEVVRGLVAAAHDAGVAVVMSSHDFAATPPRAELLARLRRMHGLGADIPKIAVMPADPGDVLVLLEATWTMHRELPDVPLITMAMAGTGVVSRLAGEVFGSAATFGTVGAASAPGQVDADELRRTLDLLHRAR